MKIKFNWSFEVDRKKFPNLTAEQIRDHFISCAESYMQQVEEETLNLLADVNIENKKK
jgi:flagellar assembly factor FliW